MQKPPPDYSLEYVLHPERDASYTHFDSAATNRFQATPAAFPRVNAWWLAEAALLTYWDPTQAIPIFARAGFECQFITANSTDCYVLAQKDSVIVAFRGTQPGEWEDMLADVNIILVPWQSGRVHFGFKKALDVIRPQLDPILQRLSPDRTLWFCGHSLGAALATLAADSYPATRGVCTFGSPRVGDLVFANAFNARLAGKSLRYVNNHDVVTHVPLPIPYEHIDLQRFIAPEGTVSSVPPAILHFFADLIGEPKQILEIIDALLDGTLQTAPKFLLDHMPKAYASWTWNDYDANG